MKCCGGGKIVGFYLHPQNDYFEKGFFVFVVSFSINSVTMYFNGRNGEHLFSKEYICPLGKARAISLQFKVLKAM